MPVFGQDKIEYALDKAFKLFWEQKGMDGELIMVRPSFLLIPMAMHTTILHLLSMRTDGSPLGKCMLYQDFPVIDFDSHAGIENYYPYGSVYVANDNDGDENGIMILPPSGSCHCRPMTSEEVEGLIQRLKIEQ